MPLTRTTLLLALVLFGCGAPVPIKPRVATLPATALLTAPIIVSGTLVSMLTLSGTVSLPTGCKLSFESIEVKLDQTYRGNVDPSKTISFVRGAPDVGCVDGSHPNDTMQTGERRLLFLIYDGANLRAFCDVFKTSLLLAPVSGQPGFSRTDGPLALKISRLLLEPQPNQSAESYARFSTRHATSTVPVLLGRAGTQDLLLSVYKSSADQNIRAYACTWIYLNSLFGDECVINMMNQANLLLKESLSEVEKVQREFGGGKRNELDEFLTDPTRWLRSRSEDLVGRRDIVDTLKKKTQASNDERLEKAIKVAIDYVQSESQARKH